MACKPLLAASALTLFAVPTAIAAQTIEWRPGPEAASVRYADGAPISYSEFRRMAYDEGYREGTKEGENDARRGERFGYQDEKEFQRGDRGFHRNYGDRDRYRELFRDGFAAGYSDGYARRAGYRGYGGWQGQNGRPGPYAQGGYGGWGGYGRTQGRGYYSPAFDNGARDGYEKGQEDARKNRSYDVLRHSRYRSGDHDYRDEYGSKEQYRNVYRQGFNQGYDRGYREGRYRW